TEEANQLLRYHLAQQRGVIPLRRLRFIRAHADRPLLVQPNARRLLRKSLIVPAVFSGAMVFVAVLMAGGLYLMATAGIQWQEKVIGRHWEEGEAGEVDYKTLPKNGQITSGIKRGGKHIRFWDGKNGKMLLCKEKEENAKISISRDGKFILSDCNLINITDDTEIKITQKCGRYNEKSDICGKECKFSDSEKYISYHICNLDENTIAAALYSIDKKQIDRRVDIVQSNNNYEKYEFQFSDNRERLVVINNSESNVRVGEKTIELYNAVYSEIIKKLFNEPMVYDISFDIFSKNEELCITSNNSVGDASVILYHLDDGRKMSSITLSVYISMVYFSSDGNHIILFNSNTNKDKNKLSILNASDLNPVQGTKIEKVYLGNVNNVNSEPSVYWQDGNDVKLWHVSKGEPILLKNIKFGDKDSVSSSADMQRAVIWGPQRPAELWDVKEKKLLRSLTFSKDKHIQSVAFSMNDTAVVITEEGGVASLFDAKDGSPLAQHISAASVYYYDPDLRRIHLWNSSGQVIRHVEGRSYFGWFRPTKKGAMD
ncbi:WD40 repeat domain-containing protein, partial [Candidatus Electronema sp. JC]|uniref:WD40 repeat domain-containing protein n=1 Tax=Candidatus Electronema sp. JC TaxID=3401570 RepID=UPI003B433BB5